MAERSIAHGSFTVKRSYPHPPAKVFRYWADPALKRRWYGAPEQDDDRRVFEFRNGGREFNGGKGPNGEQYGVDIRYYDIVPDERIIHVYDVWIAGTLTSVSMAAVEFKPQDNGTLLTITEHGAFFDGLEPPPDRVAGTEWVLDRLGEVLTDDADKGAEQ
jgi:uncharacterized protein YndB with AHSA1/START domain